MATITTRASKGAPLSWDEADANFINLNADKVETSILANYSTTVETDASIAAALAVHTTDAIDAHVSSAIGYLPAGTGATVTDVQTKLREFVSVKDFGAVGDGTADDTNTIQAFFTYLAVNGGAGHVPPGTYKVSGTISIAAPVHVQGNGAKIAATGHFTVFAISSSDVSIAGFEIEGAGYSADGDGKLIVATGTDNGAATPPAYIQNIVVRDCYLHDAGYSGVRGQFVAGLVVEGCRIERVCYAGVAASSCKDVSVRNNVIGSITSGGFWGNEYGVYFSRSNTSDLVRFPPPERCSAVDNTLFDIPWEALDCHGGSDLSFLNNKVRDCGSGLAAISITYSDNENSVIVNGPKNILCSGNVVTGADKFAIRIGGDAATIADMGSNIQITNNVIKDCGTDGSILGGIAVFSALNVLVNGNTIEDCRTTGVYVAGPHSSGVSVTNNVFKRIRSEVNAVAAIRVARGASATGKTLFVDGNQLIPGGVGDTHDCSYGVQLSSSDAGSIKLGANSFAKATVKPHIVTSDQVGGYSSTSIQTGRVVVSVTTSVSFVDTTVTIPEKYSDAAQYNVVASLASESVTGYYKIGVLAKRVTDSTFLLRVFTVDGTNFAANASVPFSWITAGY